MSQRQRDILIDTIEEDRRCNNFIRIFPAKGSDVYNNYFEATRNSNRFLYQCLYGKLIFNEVAKVEKIEEISEFKRTTTSTIGSTSDLIITIDDILMEYIRRLVESVKVIPTIHFKQVWRRALLNFVNSSMWHEPIDQNQQ